MKVISHLGELLGIWIFSLWFPLKDILIHFKITCPMVLALSNEEMKIPKIWKEWLENFFLGSNVRDKYIINYKM